MLCMTLESGLYPVQASLRVLSPFVWKRHKCGAQEREIERVAGLLSCQDCTNPMHSV